MKKKILFVNDEMTMGGVARILNTFLSMIDKNKYDVDLLLLHERGELLNEIPEGVNVLKGTAFFNRVDIPIIEKFDFSKLRLLFYMKTGLIKRKIAIERKKILSKHYDIEFAAKEGFCTIFTAYGDSDLKINWIQTDYKQNNYSKNHMNLVKEALHKIDMNIACSESVKNSYSEVFGVDNIVVIHNLIDEERIKKLANEKMDVKTATDKINIVCVARFHPQKGLDRLLNVYAKVKDYYHLTIIGDGELKEQLYKQAKQLGVFEEIDWLGIMANPYPVVKANDLFVMPSLYEGYPTITIESLLSTTPVLTTEVSGVKEQLTKEEYGFIVDNNENAIYQKLDELKGSKEILKEYKEKLVNYKYNNEDILNSYYYYFDELKKTR